MLKEKAHSKNPKEAPAAAGLEGGFLCSSRASGQAGRRKLRNDSKVWSMGLDRVFGTQYSEFHWGGTGAISW